MFSRLWWFLIGAWSVVLVALGLASYQDRGSADSMCPQLLFIWVVGGMSFFLLLHRLLEWRRKDGYDDEST